MKARPLTSGVRRRLSTILATVILPTAAPAQTEIPQAEPDDSIPTANDTGITAGSSVLVRASGHNGDGAFGGDNGGADVDFFRLSANAGQVLTVQVKNASDNGDFDSAIAVYNASGDMVAVNDDVVGGVHRSSELTYAVAATGDYYVCVSNWIQGSSGDEGNFPDDPQTPGTVPGIPGGTPGPYLLYIGLDLALPIAELDGTNGGNARPFTTLQKVAGTDRYEGTLRIRNSGAAPLQITAFNITGTGAAQFSLNGLTLPATVNPGTFLTAQIVFDSAGSPDLREAVLEFTGNDPYSQTFALRGRGSPVSGGGNFTVRQVHSAGDQVTDLTIADELLSGVVPASSEATTTSRVINFGDVPSGNFRPDLPYPDTDGSGEDFVMQATGPFFIRTAGTYTFVINSDDGQRLRIDGEDVIVDDALHGPENRFAAVTLAAGLHSLEYTMFERGGGNCGEVAISQTQGEFSEFSETTWELLEAYSDDADGDGMPDVWEDANGFDRNNPADAAENADEDQLTNVQEYQRGTNPRNPDTDGDGLQDHVETGTGIWVSPSDTGTNPLIADTDGDLLPDGQENFSLPNGSNPNDPDSDDDLWPDNMEVAAGSNPRDPNSTPGGVRIEILGTGTGSLLGGDLTDPEDDLDDTPPDGDGFNWVSVTGSSEVNFGGEGALDVFDNKLGPGDDKWCCDPAPQDLTVEFAEPVSLTHFTASSANDVPGRDPAVWGIYGSNDGITFTPIVEINGATGLWTQRLQVIRFTLPAPAPPYRFIQYRVDAQSGEPLHQIGELEYFGISGGTPPPTTTFRILEASRSPNGDITLTWPSAAGRTYTVSWSTDLLQFTPVTGQEGLPGEADGTMTATFPAPVDGAARLFFRVTETTP